MAKISREYILAADIGGTNTRLLLFEVVYIEGESIASIEAGKEAPGICVLNKRYQNEHFDSFISVIKQFFIDAGVQDNKPPLSACFAVAGPVKDNIVRFTNRDSWSIDGLIIEQTFGIKKVILINDFLAVGYGILTLNESEECITLQYASKDYNAPIACIGAGTGLGECFLTPTLNSTKSNPQYQCFPTEGGHAEFAPRNELEVGLLMFLKKKFEQKNRISVERVVSGSGLVNIYEYLSSVFPNKINKDIHDKIYQAGDLKGAIIANNKNNCELCSQTMDLFITAYGAEAGVAALKWMPYGGLYLTGGLTPKNIDLIKDTNGPFMEAFRDKGRVSGMLCSIPIFAVMVDNLGERGAHFMAYKLYGDIINSSNNDLLINKNGDVIDSSNKDLLINNNNNNNNNKSSYINLINSCQAVAVITLVVFGLLRAKKIIK